MQRRFSAMRIGRPQLGRHSWLWVVLGLPLVCFLWVYLPLGLSIAYNYIWWTLWSSTVRVASPALTVNTPAVVPKILHQTWRDKEVPEKWKEAQRSCIEAHPGYEYRLWTDEDATKLIEEKFPWFLESWLKYPYNIQRADVLRYFVLYEYGGIYLDLDVYCLKSLEYLRHYNFTAPKTYPIGVSNDVLIAQPKDAFSHHLIQNLSYWRKWLFFKYVTVMFTTGPMFVTVQYTLFKQRQGVTVMPPEVYGKYKKTDQAYLRHLHGSSWHGNDAKYVFWLEHNGLFSVGIVAFLAATVLLSVLAYKRQLNMAANGLRLPSTELSEKKESSDKSGGAWGKGSGGMMAGVVRSLGNRLNALAEHGRSGSAPSALAGVRVVHNGISDGAGPFAGDSAPSFLDWAERSGGLSTGLSTPNLKDMK